MRKKANKEINNKWVLLVIFTIFIGIFFRLYKIDIVPFGTNHDGALSAIWAIELSQKPLPVQVYHSSWLGQALSRYIMAVFIKIFGPTILAERLGMTVFTIFALPIFYLLVKIVFKNTALAWFSLFLLSVSGWDITYAKSGWPTSSVPVFEIATIYFLWRSIRNQQAYFYIFTGIFLALSLNTYSAAQFMPIIVIGWLIFFSKNKISFSKYFRNLAVFFCFLIIFIFPLFSYAITHWENYKSRMDFLFVGNRIKREGSFRPLFDNVNKIATMYNLHGGGDDFFIREPLLDFPVNWLFLLGLTVVLIKFTKKENLFLLFWFLTSLIPSLAGTPNGSHGIGSLPPVYIFSGIGLLTLYQVISKIKTAKKYNIHNIFILLILFSAAYTTFNLYLGPSRRELWGFYPETTVVGNYMKPRIANTDFYLTDNYPRDALTYLTYQGQDPWIKHYTWFDNGNSFLNVEKQANKSIAFVMFPAEYNRPVLNNLMVKYPQGIFSTLQYIDDNINRPAAWVFTVN